MQIVQPAVPGGRCPPAMRNVQPLMATAAPGDRGASQVETNFVAFIGPECSPAKRGAASGMRALRGWNGAARTAQAASLAGRACAG